MNITSENIKDKENIETIARDILRKLNITKNYDEYMSVAKMGIAKGIKNFDSEKNVKLSTHLYNMAKYAVLDYRKKIIKNNYRFKNIEDSNIINSNINMEKAVINRLDSNFNTKIMNKALSLLNDNEIDILKKRFWNAQTYSKIANKQQKSKQAIQQSLKKILKKMENFLIKENFTNFNAIFSLEDKMTKLTNQEREEIINELKMKIEKNILDFDAYAKLSRIYRDANEIENYISLKKEIISIFEPKAEELNNAKVFTLLANAYSVIKEYDKCLIFDKKALELESENPQLLKNVGLSEFLLGNYYNAVKYLKKAVKKDDKDIETYDFLIKSLINLKKNDEIVFYYKKIITVFEDISEELNSVEVFTLLADAYSVTKEYDKSLIFDKKALELEPDNTQFLKNVGLSYYLLKDYKNASEYLKKVLDKNPEDKEAKEFLNKSLEN